MSETNSYNSYMCTHGYRCGHVSPTRYCKRVKTRWLAKTRIFFFFTIYSAEFSVRERVWSALRSELYTRLAGSYASVVMTRRENKRADDGYARDGLLLHIYIYIYYYAVLFYLHVIQPLSPLVSHACCITVRVKKIRFHL